MPPRYSTARHTSSSAQGGLRLCSHTCWRHCSWALLPTNYRSCTRHFDYRNQRGCVGDRLHPPDPSVDFRKASEECQHEQLPAFLACIGSISGRLQQGPRLCKRQLPVVPIVTVSGTQAQQHKQNKGSANTKSAPYHFMHTAKNCWTPR